MSVWISAIRTKGLKRVIFINLPYVRTCKIVYKKWYSIVLLSCKGHTNGIKMVTVQNLQSPQLIMEHNAVL